MLLLLIARTAASSRGTGWLEQAPLPWDVFWLGENRSVEDRHSGNTAAFCALAVEGKAAPADAFCLILDGVPRLATQWDPHAVKPLGHRAAEANLAAAGPESLALDVKHDQPRTGAVGDANLLSSTDVAGAQTRLNQHIHVVGTDLPLFVVR